jgi:hypothetical protein
MAQWRRCRPTGPGIAGSSPAEVIDFAWHPAHAERKNKAKRVTTVGFEPTPLRAGALRQRPGPIGQTIMADASVKKDNGKTTLREETPNRCSYGVRANALPDWRPKPAPETTRPNCASRQARVVCVRAAGQISPRMQKQDDRGFEPAQLALVELESAPWAPRANCQG